MAFMMRFDMKPLHAIFHIICGLGSLAVTYLSIVALADKDWPQACAWLLAEIAITLSSLATDHIFRD